MQMGNKLIVCKSSPHFVYISYLWLQAGTNAGFVPLTNRYSDHKLQVRTDLDLEICCWVWSMKRSAATWTAKSNGGSKILLTPEFPA